MKKGINSVKVADIHVYQDKFKQVYHPGHPDADEKGYVKMPDINMMEELVNIMSATRSYEANITALNSSKAMLLKALTIGGN